jgi:hypothetical protein
MIRRDSKTRALINNDVQALNKYKQERALYQKVERLSTEVVEIKQLLVTVTQRLDDIEK